jgi:hypothetical protein
VWRPPDLDQRHVAGLFHADILEGSHADIPRTMRRMLRLVEGEGAAPVPSSGVSPVVI